MRRLKSLLLGFAASMRATERLISALRYAGALTPAWVANAAAIGSARTANTRRSPHSATTSAPYSQATRSRHRAHLHRGALRTRARGAADEREESGTATRERQRTNGESETTFEIARARGIAEEQREAATNEEMKRRRAA